MKNQDIFLKDGGKLKIFKCLNIIPSKKLEDFRIELSNSVQSEQNSITYSFRELIIRPRKIYLTISRTPQFRKSEVEIIKWLNREQLQSFIYLKKPVNNLEIGYIQNININLDNIKKKVNKDNKNKSDVLTINNIFGKQKNISFKELELISFEYNGVLIQLKSATSLTSRLGYKILKKFKPERIIMT